MHGQFKVNLMYNTRCIIACNSRSRFDTRTTTVSHHSDGLGEPIKIKKLYDIGFVLLYVYVTIMTRVDVTEITEFLHLTSPYDVIYSSFFV